MIPVAHIIEWRSKAPWPNDAQIEQDLVLSRALVSIFSHEYLSSALAFRGGTALHKLFLSPAGRYSEDIDLVQVKDGSRQEIMDALPSILQPWLGKPKWQQSDQRLTYIFRFKSEIEPVMPMRLKVEINMNENFSILGYKKEPFTVESRWFNGSAAIQTYAIEELFGTKLRALYQRKKGRDLYDLAMGIRRLSSLDAKKVVACFEQYMSHESTQVTRAKFEANMAAKLTDKTFIGDIKPLLASGVSFDAAAAYADVHAAFIAQLPGDPWKGSKD